MKQISINKWFVLLVLFSITELASAQNSWENKAAFGGSKRSRGVGFSIGNRGYIGTGEDTANNVLSDFWEYDPGTDTWIQKASMPTVGRRDATAFVIGNKAYVGMGIDAAESALGTERDDLWEYDPTTNIWTSKAPIPVPGAGVYFCTGFSINGKGYACGGKLGNSNYSDVLYCYDPVLNQWTQVSNYPGGDRYGMAAFVLNNKAYIGTGTDEDVLTRDFHVYDPITNTWSACAQLPGSGRFACTGFSIGPKGYIALGTDGGFKDELWEYDPINNYWSLKAPFGGNARRSASGFVINGAAYVGTGSGASGSRRDFWQYDQYLVGTGEQTTQPTLVVFPNPANDYTTIQIPEQFVSQELQIQLFTVDGRLCNTFTVQNTSSYALNLNTYTSGVYLIAVRNASTLLSQTRLLIR